MPIQSGASTGAAPGTRETDVLKPGKDGKPTRSVLRSTYLIDEEGVIVKAFVSTPKDYLYELVEYERQGG